MQVSERKMNLIEFESHNKLHASSDFLGSENKVPDCHCIAATTVGADTDGLSFITYFVHLLESAGQELVGCWRVETSVLNELIFIEVNVHV